ncbi:Lrp/AsnC family transcriptional regulator [Rhodobacteraceae bacterium]|nr:Lrp/AsnC family transcriptional regulator [Paracoccaceae bacterium]
MSSELDAADRVILDVLQHDATKSLDALSEACELSVPTVQRRLKRLRELNVIDREVAVIDPQKVGQLMSFIVMVEMERERIDHLDAFRRAARAEPQVQQCYYVTGEADFCIICTAKDMGDFEALTQRLFFDNGNIRRFRTSVVMDRSKVGLAVNLGGD